MTESNLEDAIDGLGNCQDATNPKLLNMLINMYLEKLKDDPLSLSQGHIIKLISILPNMTHPGAINHHTLIENLIVELDSRLKGEGPDKLKMYEILSLAGAFRKYKFRKEAKTTIITSYNTIIYQGLLECFSDKVSNPAVFGLKHLHAITFNQNMITSYVDSSTVAVYQNIIQSDYSKFKNSEKFKIACLLIMKMISVNRGSISNIEKDVLKEIIYLPASLNMENKTKDFWYTVQEYVSWYVPLMDGLSDHDKDKLPSQVISIGKSIESEIENLFTDKSQMYKHQVNACMLAAELIITCKDPSKWIDILVSCLRSMEDGQFRATMKHILNSVTVLQHRFRNKIGKSGIRSVFQLITGCKKKVLIDPWQIARCFEFICNSIESDLTTIYGEPCQELNEFIKYTTTIDQEMSERLSQVMTFNDLKRIVYRCNMLDLDNHANLKMIVAFKIAGQVNRDISLASVISSFELLDHFDEEWSKAYLRYPEIIEKIKNIESLLKIGKMRSANTLVKVFKMLVCLDSFSLEKEKIDEDFERSHHLDMLVKKSMLKIDEEQIHKERVREMLENCKILCMKGVEGTVEGSNSKNIVLSFNLMSVLLEHHLRIEPLSAEEQSLVIAKISV